MAGPSQKHDDAVQAIVHKELEDVADVTPGMVLTEWVLIATTVGYREDGAEVAQHLIIQSDSPRTRLWGLIRDADARYHADALELYGSDD